MASLVEFSRTGAVAGITLSSPETINRVCADRTEALLEAREATNADTLNVCATLVARGDVFCAGGDFAFELGWSQRSRLPTIWLLPLGGNLQDQRQAVAATVRKRSPRREGR